MTSVADAPSESCEELPAVTLPWPLVGSNTGGNFRQPVERRVGPVALVGRHRHVSSPIFVAGLLVEHGARDVDRRELVVEEAFGLCPRRPLLAEQRVLVLRLRA